MLSSGTLVSQMGRVLSPCPPSSTGAFFIPYFIFFFTCGIPVFFLEVALGQYTSQGSVTAWRKICPLLQGECSPLPSYQGPQESPSLRCSSPFLPCHHLLIRLLWGTQGSVIRIWGAQNL